MISEYVTYRSPIGMIAFECSIGSVEFLDLAPQSKELLLPTSPLAQDVYRQLDEYFQGTRQHFDFPISVQGTTFEQRVYKTLSNVPYGSTISYQELAFQAGYPRASRAVGSAMKKNKFPLTIPCHRVIKANGSLGFYGGGEQMKAWLLSFEEEHKLK
ncbi:MAG: methylated-DNA--[protein]-cysteine S-methyltransferase [Candidatus Izemoplasmatales bacterium]|nr:methylated-DNA--[protein]-cysteine S-methyltransferase [bacterium]MDZ4197530.1 methylated-DNA--[protein]-cysteine S-methyltransferase [Candidatus Izemoplasmatales bacterium]